VAGARARGSEVVTAAPGRRPRLGRLFSLLLALVALGFVAWVIPLRDRCWDPRSPKSTRVAITRERSGATCVLHLSSGDVPIDAASCASLRCEPGVVSTLAGARGGVLAALLGVYALGTFAWAARWRALLGFADLGTGASSLRIAEVWRISIEAQAGGILLPGGLGGDAFRVASIVGRPAPGQTRPALAIVVASVLLDRAIGLSLIAAVAAGLGFAFAGRGGGVGEGAGTLLAVLAAIPLGVGLTLALLRGAPGTAFVKLLHGKGGGAGGGGVLRAVESILTPVLAYLRDPRAPRAIAAAVAWSVVVAVTQLVVVRGLVFALGASPSAASEKWVYVGAAMAFIVGAVPALPGGWGTADATYVFFFGLAGLSAGVGLSVCLLFRLFWYLSGIVGGILHLTRSHRAARDATTGPLGNS
jgi:uncharacterized membrane protein YbhN (UPF0104 family)